MTPSFLTSTRAWFRRCGHILLPVDCASCHQPLAGDPYPLFCHACWEGIRPLPQPTCPCCGRPFASTHALAYSPTHRCSRCRQDPPAFTRAWSLYPYEPPLKDAIQLFKYHGKVSLAGSLSELLLRALPTLPSVDLILPVPLHASRIREREYNQSSLLAVALSRALQVPLSHTTLIRTRATPPQSSLTRRERLHNLRRAFAVHRPSQVAGRSMLLVDDVLTTGATANEASAALTRAGAHRVYVVTLARML